MSILRTLGVLPSFGLEPQLLEDVLWIGNKVFRVSVGHIRKEFTLGKRKNVGKKKKKKKK